MRQIHVCAWLLVTPFAAVACSGEQFTTSDGDASSGSSAGRSYVLPGDRSEAAGSSDDDSAAGGSGTSSGGKAPAGGTTSSGGATGSAGATSSGGDHSSNGGNTGAAGSAACAMGAVKLKMVPSPDLPTDYLCDAGCGTGWLTITDAQGAAAFSIFSGCGSTSCDSCASQPCASAACLPTPLNAAGNELTWAGTYMTEDSCGANQACQRPACVMPGKYKAKACAALNAGSNDAVAGSCTPKDVQLCAEAEFEFPGTGEVKLVLKKQ